jgi:hypothetical protein
MGFVIFSSNPDINGLLITALAGDGDQGMFPTEIGTWGADFMEYQGEDGDVLLIMGGFNKSILANPRSSGQIDFR